MWLQVTLFPSPLSPPPPFSPSPLYSVSFHLSCSVPLRAVLCKILSVHFHVSSKPLPLCHLKWPHFLWPWKCIVSSRISFPASSESSTFLRPAAGVGVSGEPPGAFQEQGYLAITSIVIATWKPFRLIKLMNNCLMDVQTFQSSIPAYFKQILMPNNSYSFWNSVS